MAWGEPNFKMAPVAMSSRDALVLGERGRLHAHSPR